MSRFQVRAGERLHWRATVRTTGALESSRTSPSLMWHLVACADPTRLDAHCPVGLELLSSGVDPEGHCLVDGECPRCALANAPVLPPTAPSPPLAADTLAADSEVVQPVAPPVEN